MDVFDVRPQDLKVIMALGDSYTAAFSASAPIEELNRGFLSRTLSSLVGIELELFEESRGLSFSMGQDEDKDTLPNYFKHYSPSIVGGSEGQHLMTFCWGRVCPLPYHPRKDVLNAAISGGQTINLEKEFKYLTNRITSLPDLSMENDWKLVSLFIGINDVCRLSCHGTIEKVVIDYMDEVTATIAKLKQNFPKTIVAVYLLPDVSLLAGFMDVQPRCQPFQYLKQFLCPCAATQDQSGREAMTKASELINVELVKVIATLNDSYRQEAMERNQPQDFALMTIPVFTKVNPMDPNFPETLMSAYDCFHPSALAHENLAKEVW